jgi:tRNA 2-selenouridine synthase
MAVTLSALSDLAALPADTIIDVRSPSEHAEDHVPGAISLPVLDDDERARVGTIYKQESPFRARKIGAALVARNAARHIETALAEKDGGWRPLVYCWRGGQRSGSFATILAQVGWRTEVLEGGYRSYRRLVVRALYDDPWPMPLVVIDGNTGTAKTALLERLGRLGAQVIDLEGLARHRGSVLGPDPAGQPSQKAFETGIATALAVFNPTRPVVVEAESSKVGDLIVPPRLWAVLRAAPRVVIEAPLEARASYLARAYGDLAADPERLVALLAQLAPFHGTERVARWQDMARDGDRERLAAELAEIHYDPRYAKSRGRWDGPVKSVLRADSLDEPALDELARELRDLIG